VIDWLQNTEKIYQGGGGGAEKGAERFCVFTSLSGGSLKGMSQLTKKKKTQKKKTKINDGSGC